MFEVPNGKKKSKVDERRKVVEKLREGSVNYTKELKDYMTVKQGQPRPFSRLQYCCTHVPDELLKKSIQLDGSVRYSKADGVDILLPRTRAQEVALAAERERLAPLPTASQTVDGDRIHEAISGRITRRGTRPLTPNQLADEVISKQATIDTLREDIDRLREQNADVERNLCQALGNLDGATEQLKEARSIIDQKTDEIAKARASSISRVSFQNVASHDGDTRAYTGFRSADSLWAFTKLLIAISMAHAYNGVDKV